MNGVGAALLLTVYQREILPKDSVGLALVLFGLGVLCCALGMMRLITWFPLSPGTETMADVPLLAVLVGSFFVQAVVATLSAAFDIPISLLITVLGILLLALAWRLSGSSFFGFRLPRREEPP